MHIPDWAPAAAAVTALGALGGTNVLRRGRRRRAYREYCGQRGLTFADDRSTISAAVWMSIPLFTQGWAQRWRFGMNGSRSGVGFWAGEWSFFTGGIRSNTRHVFGVIVWQTGEALPPFTCIPNAEYRERLPLLVPGDDPRLAKEAMVPEGVVNAGRAYWVRAVNDEDMRMLLTPERRAFLETHPGQHLAAGRGSLVWWKVGELPSPEDLDAFLREGDAARAVFTRFAAHAA